MKTSKIENSIISASAATKIQKLEQLVHLWYACDIWDFTPSVMVVWFTYLHDIWPLKCLCGSLLWVKMYGAENTFNYLLPGDSMRLFILAKTVADLSGFVFCCEGSAFVDMTATFHLDHIFWLSITRSSAIAEGPRDVLC